MAMKLKCGIRRKIRAEVKRAGTCPEREGGGAKELPSPASISMSIHTGSVWAPLQNQFKKLPFSRSSVIRIL